MGVTVLGATTYIARNDSGTAGNNAVNPDAGTINIQFSTDDPDVPGVDTSGDLILNFGTQDPNTSLVYNGNSYAFKVELVGTMLGSYPPGADVHSSYLNQQVVIVSFTDNLGTVHRVFFFPTVFPQSLANMADIRNGSISLGSGYQLTCLCEGTEIMTANGGRAIETVRVGDFLLNDLGVAKQVIWIGSSTVSAAELELDEDVRPIRIPAGAFGAAGPQSDLYVSPQHRVVVEGAAPSLLFGEDRVLVAAKHLVESGIAEQTNPGKDVRYYHVMFEDHELLVTNGLVTESFQPARRTLDVMSKENQARLLAAIEALGVEEMLTRPDALPSLNRREGTVLAAQMSTALPRIARDSSEEHRLH